LYFNLLQTHAAMQHSKDKYPQKKHTDHMNANKNLHNRTDIFPDKYNK